MYLYYKLLQYVDLMSWNPEKITKSAKVFLANLLANFSPSGMIKALETCQSFLDCLLTALLNMDLHVLRN